MTLLTIQLVTYNAEKYIPLLFSSLAKQTATSWKLLVLDNASSDNTVQLVHTHGKTLHVSIEVIVQEKNTGFSGGHNRLFLRLDTPFVLLLNQDMYLHEQCIEELLSTAQKYGEFGALTPRIMRWDAQKALQGDMQGSFLPVIDTLGLRVLCNRRVLEIGAQEKWNGQIHDFAGIHQTTNGYHEIFGVSGAFPLYHSAALADIALPNGTIFDESYFMYKEDVDLAFRLRSRGYASYLVPEAIVYHDRTAAQGEGLTDISAAQNKKTQSQMVRANSYANHLKTLYKNEYWQNLFLDFFSIIWYEGKKFCWYLFNDRRVLGGLYRMFAERKQLRQCRAHIFHLRRISWKQLRIWWT